ncbi:MAG: peptide deformylase [Clostridiales bacterium]|jgi:peptide deformylase|nr:peptide deformylase [Clostridiales bacterium]
MAIRRILKYGQDDILHKKSKPVEKINKRILDLLDDMAETMRSADGVGLAAPQVGVLRRVVVIDLGDGLLELINPEILETSGQQQGPEGCLSIPGAAGEVIRPERVKVKALNRNGEIIEIEGTDLLARALCHEIDHLDGILFIEKVIPDTLEGKDA